MKFIVHVGPDTLGIESTSKKSILNSIRRSINKRTMQSKVDPGHCGITWKNRLYNYHELKEAVVIPLGEYFKAIKI